MLNTGFLNVDFENPLVLASGILGVTGASMAKVVREGGGGVTMKSVRSEEVQGNPNPVMLGQEAYMLNAVGLPGPGIDNAIPELRKFKQLCDGVMIGSIFGTTVEEFGEVAASIDDAPIDILEVDISCPHASHLYEKPFAHDLKSIEQITSIVKKNTSVPVVMKLSPNTWNITEYAKAAEAAGADGITAINTLVGMEINAEARRPVLANRSGGVSGPAIKPVALKAVYDITAAVNIPVIGTGGITNGRDAIEMVMAGATLLGVGSAFYYRGPKALGIIAAEMKEWMEDEGVKSLDEIRGVAHNE